MEIRFSIVDIQGIEISRVVSGWAGRRQGFFLYDRNGVCLLNDRYIENDHDSPALKQHS